MPKTRFAGLVLALFCCTTAAADTQPADDAATELRTMLDEFLAGTSDAGVHDSFWHESLVYTSSSGTRFGKADIMQGLADAGEDSGPATTTYAGEDVEIQLFGDTAVITFTLLGTPVDDAAVQKYLNTGVFRRSDGDWRVVAWHATRMATD